LLQIYVVVRYAGYKRPFPASAAYHLIIKNTCLGINEMFSHVRNSLQNSVNNWQRTGMRASWSCMPRRSITRAYLSSCFAPRCRKEKLRQRLFPSTSRVCCGTQKLRGLAFRIRQLWRSFALSWQRTAASQSRPFLRNTTRCSPQTRSRQSPDRSNRAQPRLPVSHPLSRQQHHPPRSHHGGTEYPAEQGEGGKGGHRV
jgi:hypothetical protein